MNLCLHKTTEEIPVEEDLGDAVGKGISSTLRRQKTKLVGTVTESHSDGSIEVDWLDT